MTPGPTIILKCSSCCKLIKQHTIGSGNTFGATYWTDGNCEAPMLPDEPDLVKCPHCSTLVWIEELENVGEIEFNSDEGDEFKEAKAYVTPTAGDFQEALASGIQDRKKECYLRLHAWWAGNNKRRKTSKGIPLSDDEKANLRAFSQFLYEDDENCRLMKAEIFRELGEFEEAMSLLAKPFGEDVAPAANIIKSLTEQKNPLLKKMEFR